MVTGKVCIWYFLSYVLFFILMFVMLAVLNKEALSTLVKTLHGKMQEGKAGNTFWVTFGKTVF